MYCNSLITSTTIVTEVSCYGFTILVSYNRMSKSSILVLSATGNQGGKVTRQLLADGQSVHALTRDPESSSAKELRSAGAAIFKGSFDDANSIKRAAEGCRAMFLVVVPSPRELDDARNVIEAARTSGITKCVYSSVTNCDKVVNRPEFDENILRASYFLNKNHIQDLVMSQFSSWTILQPGAFMTNMMDPIGRLYFSRLGTEHVLHGAWKPNTKIHWIDPLDIANFAAAALETDRFEHQKVPLAGDSLTVPELATLISEVSGDRIDAEYIGDEAVSAQRDKNPLVVSADWTNKGWFDIDVESVKSWGIEMSTVKQFLSRQKESGLLAQSLQPK